MRRIAGTSAHSRQRRAPTGAYVGVHQSTIEEPHPAQLGELGHVGVEHEVPRVLEVDLDDPALALAQHDGVGVLEPVGRPGGVVAEELAVQVKRVHEVELGDVHEVDPHGARTADADRMARVVERPAVDGVELVRAVAVRVVAVHHHDELLRRRARGLGSMISAP